MRPFLKWAGGKRQLLPYIKKYINEDVLKDDCKYYEPFVGGGSVLFDLAYGNCVINDYNSEIVNVYEVIRDHPKALIKMLKTHEKRDSKEYYYQIRELDRKPNFSKMGAVKRAARTIYLNKTCYNGLYRVNKQGYFNTPRGKYANPLICDAENIAEVSDYLKKNGIRIMNTDFSVSVSDCKEGDFIYLDPPYDYEDQNGFVSYNATGFTRDDLVRMKVLCDVLIEKGCNVLISNNDTTFVRELFKGDNYKVIYQIDQVKANRSINSSGKSRGTKASEVLIYGTRNKENTIPASR